MSKPKEPIQVTCPCCHSTLTVDAESGLVLNSKTRKSDYSFEAALEKIRSRKEKADELFEKAVLDEKRRHESLEKKFRRALESKDELEDPDRVWDRD